MSPWKFFYILILIAAFICITLRCINADANVIYYIAVYKGVPTRKTTRGLRNLCCSYICIITDKLIYLILLH